MRGEGVGGGRCERAALDKKALDGMARIERVVLNIENNLRPKVHVLLDTGKIRQDDKAPA